MSQSVFSYDSALDGCSPESFGFLSTRCISHELQYYVYVSYIAIFLLGVVTIVALIIRAGVKSRRWTISCSVLSLALLIMLGLLLQQLSNFLGFRGVLRMFFFGVPLASLVIAVPWVFTAWFVAVLSASLEGQRDMKRNLWVAYFSFNAVFQLLFWAFWLSAGGFDQNPRLHNILAGMAIFLLGVSAVFLGVGIHLLGRKLVTIMRGSTLATALSDSQGRKLEESATKILKYSLAQSFLWVSGGLSAIGVGVWAFASGYEGVTGFYYLINFAWAPMTSMVVALLVYVALMVYRGEGRTEGGSVSNDKSKTTAVLSSSGKVDEFIGELQQARENSVKPETIPLPAMEEQ